MQLRPCENCHSLSRVVESKSPDATELTIRCNGCGHVWTEPKSHPEGSTVTPQPKK